MDFAKEILTTKDKQNYDAVLHIIRASELLDNIPDATGTKCYVEVMQSVVESYLNKSLDPLTRIEKIWYAVFFLRYWRQWILLCPQYTLKDNFITNNAYICIELNAHALMFLMTVRDNCDDGSFLPWRLGSQTCEKAFSAARSMTSTFSTTDTLILSMFSCVEGESKAKSKPRKYLPFLQVDLDGKSLYIRKTTAVWLFQEGERVSSDRLFRVRCKQPYSTTTSLVKQNVNLEAAQPIISSTVQIGELCVFQVKDGWRIGRVLQFAKYQEKTVSAQQYKGSSADVTKSNVGVLCCWYTPIPGSSSFQTLKGTSTFSHCYHPLNSYGARSHILALHV